jgi:2OG-Fe(II) oxygenase superfamily
MLQVGRSSLVCTESPEKLDVMRRSFQRLHALHLPCFLHAELLKLVQHNLRRARFSEREDEGLARELCMAPNSTLAMLLLVFNDTRLFEVIRRITGCAAIASYAGRIYEMHQAAHYDGWHSDVDGTRLIGMSVNLTGEAFSGGRFELRATGGHQVTWSMANTEPGDAVVFEISDALQHRVTEVEGHVPRVTFAGWFQSQPDFLDVLKRRSGIAEGHEVY